MAGASNPVDDLLALFSRRRFSDMETRARAMLAGGADAAIVHHLYGLALVAQDRHAEALPPLQAAVARVPTDAQFWENLALCQRHLGLFADAEASLRRALEIRPDAPDTLNALGHLLVALGRNAEAEAVLRRALAAAPNHAAANFNLGKALLATGDPRALRHLERAVAGAPQVAAFHEELGRALLLAGDAAAAEACFRRAVERDRGNPERLAPLALALSSRGARKEAAAIARAALAGFGGAQAAAAAGRIGVLDVLADSLQGAQAYDEAVVVYRAICEAGRNAARAVAASFSARQMCDWPFAARLEGEVRSAIRAGESLFPAEPFPLLAMASLTPADQLAATRDYAARMGADVAPARPAARTRADGRLRIGYLSGDLHGHAVAYLIAGVIEAHDRTAFEIIAYDYSPPSSDPVRARLQDAFARIVPIGGLTQAAAARRIADDACDIVVDIKGWTGNSMSQILAARVAPTQVQWLGYPGTMGAPWLDYVIADGTLVPAGDEHWFAEKVVRLPHTYQPNDARRPVGAAGTRADHGLPVDALVLCSFNQPYKITPEMFDLWMTLLARVEDAVLWLLPYWPATADALRSAALRRGTDPSRLVFAPLANNADHVARLRHADIALDCYPYGSHTTASDMLFAGVPLIALAGDTFASRVSASVLNAGGLHELVTHTPQAYRDLAIELATNRAALTAMKARVAAARATPLFDTALFARHLEAAFSAISRRQRDGLPPDHVAIG